MSGETTQKHDQEQRRCRLQAFQAMAALGRKFWGGSDRLYGEPGRAKETLHEYTRDWSADMRAASCATLREAQAARAYFVESVWLDGDGRGRERYGFRLCRFSGGGGGGHCYSGDTFETGESFWRAMRMLEDVGGKKGGCADDAR